MAKGFLDSLFGELRYAVQDIRQKVVEQGWFGQVTTAKPVIEMHQAPAVEPGLLAREDLYGRDLQPTLPGRQSFEEAWAPKQRPNAPEPCAPEADKGVDL